MNTKKLISLFLSTVIVFMMGVANPVYATDINDSAIIAREHQEIYSNNKELSDFCKIQNNSGRTAFRINDKFSLSADYYSTDTNATLIWTIDGESVFIDGKTEKTETGSNAFIHFLGDTNIKLQLVSQDGEVLAEDEIIIETLPEKTFFEKVYEKCLSFFLTFWIVVIGGLGGTIGHWFN